jgi:hydroxymethylpyrimidine/phosphomethylpyrimidine kinase
VKPQNPGTVSQTNPVVLTVAGFDPSGGAGVIADVKTIQAFGCRPVAAITSLTFQNSQGVYGSIHQTAASVLAQILPLIEETEIAAVKTGMLPTAEIVLEVARLVREQNLPSPVIDPVMQSSSGYELMEPEAVKALVHELLPLARLITPNVPEAERLTGLRIEDEQGLREAARKLRELGARAVLIKGGHLKQKSEVRSQKSEETERAAIDLLDDDGNVTVLRDEWIEAPNVCGTGCMLASAIAAGLGQGKSLDEAARTAKEYVNQIIRQFAPVSTKSARDAK